MTSEHFRKISPQSLGKDQANGAETSVAASDKECILTL